MGVLKELLSLVCGPDGHLSGRRLFGFVFAVTGTILLFIAEPPKDSSWPQLLFSLRGVISIVLSTILYGFVTMQNIKDVVSTGKGT